jgi:cytochrome c biogenesis protein CcmG/thiol:disulfide interchange protein DsbE
LPGIAAPRPFFAFLALFGAFLLSACGSQGTAGNYGGKTPDYAKALAGAPKPLAQLYAHPDELIAGGSDAYSQQLAKLKGYPVVANVWASWCGPCRFEFPLFQHVSAKLGKRVAFIGVNSFDSEDAAKTFLSEYPVPYPSVSDPGQDVWHDLNLAGLPGTAYYDRSGKLTYLKQGPYTDEAEFRADIRRYALGQS